MKLDKSLKVLWFVNGIFILLLVSYGLFRSIQDLFPEDYDYDDNEVMMGQRLESAKSKGLALQGLTYTAPERVYNSDHRFMTLSATTYEESKMLLGAISAAGDISPSMYGIANIVFLDGDYKVINTLLDRKADIRNWRSASPDYNLEKGKVDTTVKNIVYEIAFEDSNKDGYLNSRDHHDIYISGLLGEDLTQVTRGIDIERFHFHEWNSKLFITYFERTDEAQEHKRKKFAIYTIATKELRLLEDLNEAIDKLESQLVN
ncbi:MAG: hypothetical protein HEP71_10475 [Roseivirga sp.]|nr:hypothetical protein [Roseivirga sp.]